MIINVQCDDGREGRLMFLDNDYFRFRATKSPGAALTVVLNSTAYDALASGKLPSDVKQIIEEPLLSPSINPFDRFVP